MVFNNLWMIEIFYNTISQGKVYYLYEYIINELFRDEYGKKYKEFYVFNNTLVLLVVGTEDETKDMCNKIIQVLMSNDVDNIYSKIFLP